MQNTTTFDPMCKARLEKGTRLRDSGIPCVSSSFRTMDQLRRDLGENYVQYDVSYMQVGLLSFQVGELRDLSAVVAEVNKATSSNREVKTLDRLARGEDARPRRRRLRTKGKPAEHADASKRRGRIPRGAKDSDTDSRTCPSSPRSSADSSLSSGMEMDQEAVAIIAAYGPGGDTDAAIAAPSSPASVPVAPAGPRHDPTTGRVYGPDGSYWGRVTIIRPGHSSESVSVYCGRHGCSICKRVAASPGRNKILAWFAAGQHVPAGRSPALQGHHKRLWPGR